VDIKTGRCIRSFERQEEWIRSIAISRDDKHIVTGSEEGHVKLWDLATGECRMSFHGHDGTVYSMCFCQDGSRLLTGSGDGTVRLWNTHNGICLRTFMHSAGIRPMKLSPDSKYVLAGGFDGISKLCDMQWGRCLMVFEGQKDWIRSVCFSADGKYAITASKDHSVCFWDMVTGALLVNLIHLNDGFLWTTPPDKDAESGWIWTDREDLLEIFEGDSNDTKRRTLPVTDPSRKQYVAIYNDQKRVMQRINPAAVTANNCFENLLTIHKQINCHENELKMLKGITE
jgi:WD40 repeat protein